MEPCSNRHRTGRTCRKRHRRMERRRDRPRFCSSLDLMIQLRKWMKKERFKCFLEPAIFSSTGRGLMATKSISPGDVIISLPVNLLITTRTVLHSDIATVIKRWNPKLSPQQTIAVFLLWERNKSVQSPWFPYISVLPDSFTTPGYFTMTELSYLPNAVNSKAKVYCEKLRKAYEDVLSFCKTEWIEFYQILKFQDFRWAWYVINTRSIYMKSERSEYLADEEDHIALAPFLDLLNHSSQATIAAGYNSNTNCYEITTLDKYHRYEQVFISYGPHDNQKLFLEYGFTVPDNIHDVCEFFYEDIDLLNRPDPIPHWDRKMAVLRENKLLQSLCCSMEGLSWKLWTVLKTFAMDWNQLQNWRQVFEREELPDKIGAGAKIFAQRLLQKALKQNQEKKTGFDKLAADSKHSDIIDALLTIEENILTTSLQTVS